MGLSRRDFLKLTGGTAVAGAVASGLSPTEAEAKEKELRIKGAKVTNTVCPYCSVGCGILVHSKDGKVIYTEGDPENPTNEGRLCSKGGSLYQINQQSSPSYQA